MNRYREIATAFSRNGFDFFVKEVGLDKVFTLPRRVVENKRGPEGTKTMGERIRSFLEDLGPTFIKIGQMASNRPDLIPEDIMEELGQLQDEVNPFPFEDVKRIVEAELEQPLEELFDYFEEEPLGVASIGQVHKAMLYSGEYVAVKVQRPKVEKQIHTDLEILQELATRAERRLKWAQDYQVKDVIKEFSKAIKEELDYETEGRNADLMSRQFENDSSVQIPNIYWDYTSKKVLTMEFVEGIKLDDTASLQEEGVDLPQVAERLVNALFYQLFKDGHFHADPHVGNVLAVNNERLAFMDFGLMGHLSSDMKSHLAELVVAMVKQETDNMIKAIKKIGGIPEELNEHELDRDVEQFLIKYYGVPLSNISLGESITDIFRIAQEHHIKIPADLTMVGKTLLTLEGVIEKLDPDFSIIDAAEPFGRDLIREKYNPKRIAKKVFDQVHEYGDIVEDLPEVFRELSSMAKKRKLPLEINIPKADTFFAKLDQVSNRLSFAIVLLAFSLIMTGLIIGSALGRQSTMLWQVPAIEVGFVIAMLMFAWLIYSIVRSGRF
nr:AarF/ABC1/UbiB kinase family protein [Halalkalibacillus halophilus]